MSALPDSLVASTFVAIVSIDWPLVYSHLNGYGLLQSYVYSFVSYQLSFVSVCCCVQSFVFSLVSQVFSLVFARAFHRAVKRTLLI